MDKDYYLPYQSPIFAFEMNWPSEKQHLVVDLEYSSIDQNNVSNWHNERAVHILLEWILDNHCVNGDGLVTNPLLTE